MAELVTNTETEIAIAQAPSAQLLIQEPEPEQQPEPNDINLSLEELRNKYSATIMAQIKKNHYDTSEYTSYKILINKNTIKIRNKELTRKIYFGLCDDCSTLNILRETEACATGFTCCTKDVCCDDCLVYCSSGHLNKYFNSGDAITFECDVCCEMMNPKCLWHGISNAEYERRYG